MTRIGIGYRRTLHDWIIANSGCLECLEVTAEHFFGADHSLLRELGERFPLYVHGLGLSLGTPGALDAATMNQFKEVADSANAVHVSEHVAFTRSAETDLGHLNPLPRTEDSLQTFIEHARELASVTGRRVLLENITTHLDTGGEMSEPEFLNRLSAESGCALLLDITNLFINSRNHGFNAEDWLTELDKNTVAQLHIVGYECRNGAYNDSHAQPIQEDLLKLTRQALRRFQVESIILERDQRFEETTEIEADLQKLRALVSPASQSHDRT